MIESLSDLSSSLAELRQRVGAEYPGLDLGDRFVLGPADRTAVPRLTEFAGRVLPTPFVEVLSEVSLAFADLGVSFPGPDYAGRVMDATATQEIAAGVEPADRSWLMVAYRDPIYCLMDLETGVVSAATMSDPASTAVNLRCDFRSFILGLGTIREAQSGMDPWDDPEAAEAVRVKVAAELDSPPDFWRCIH